MRTRRRNLLRDESGQALTEMVILVAAVLIAVAWTTWTLPRLMSEHYQQNRDVLAAPF